jgi:hypothetical protein
MEEKQRENIFLYAGAGNSILQTEVTIQALLFREGAAHRTTYFLR